MERLSFVAAHDYAWYFAYGSNLSTDRIQQRTGMVPMARTACLYNYRLSFNLHADGTNYANIMPCPQSIVWGAAYWVSREMMSALDGYEGVAMGYYRRSAVEVETENRERLQTETYVGGERFVAEDGRPGAVYLQLILAGAREHRLPEQYIRFVEAFGTQAASGKNLTQ